MYPLVVDFLRYCKEHAALHGHKCAYWIADPSCGNNHEENRLTCPDHAAKEDEFNRRNREASWTAAQRARMEMEEVGLMVLGKLHQTWLPQEKTARLHCANHRRICGTRMSLLLYAAALWVCRQVNPKLALILLPSLTVFFHLSGVSYII